MSPKRFIKWTFLHESDKNLWWSLSLSILVVHEPGVNVMKIHGENWPMKNLNTIYPVAAVDFHTCDVMLGRMSASSPLPSAPPTCIHCESLSLPELLWTFWHLVAKRLAIFGDAPGTYL